jgi:hypothetical protein
MYLVVEVRDLADTDLGDKLTSSFEARQPAASCLANTF